MDKQALSVLLAERVEAQAKVEAIDAKLIDLKQERIEELIDELRSLGFHGYIKHGEKNKYVRTAEHSRNISIALRRRRAAKRAENAS